MAENESLDLRKARRWQRMLGAIKEGQSVGQIASLASVCLRKTINALRKPAFGVGPAQVPICDLINAVGDRCAIERIVRRCGCHDFALLFRDSSLNASTSQGVVENWLSGICEKYCDQMALQIVRPGSQYTFSQERSILEQVQSQLKPDIKLIAQQLVSNPNKTLRRSRAIDVNEKTINTESILKESLLGIKR